MFHDDQHGTAIITAAGLINALQLTGRRSKHEAGVNGAGAAGIACLELLRAMGCRARQCRALRHQGRDLRGRTEGMNQWKSALCGQDKARSLAEALEGADVFFGLSVKGAVTQEMVKSMAAKPIIFAMANPDPEITAEEARGARRCHHGDRALGLSEPDQQRARLPLHLPRRARRACHHDQHGDEDRGGERAGRTRARGRARRSGGRLRRAAEIRAGLHHSGAVRSAVDFAYVPLAVAKAAMDTGVARRPIVDMDAYGQQLRPGAIRSPACCNASSNGCGARPSASCSRKARRSR